MSKHSIGRVSWASLTAALALVGAQDAQAQSDGKSDRASDDKGTVVVVTGLRSSLKSAIDVKKNNLDIVDSIVAEDIGKLPDDNVAEALQRISGVQIGRDQGEGSEVAIRGLTQILTEMDGRPVFTATDPAQSQETGTSDRGLSFEDVPSELLAGIDVYKTTSADLDEGGIGGTINLRTHKPMDFKGFAMSGTFRETDYDNAGKSDPQFSFLVSNRWNTGLGQIGGLLSVSYQKSDYRTDEVLLGLYEGENVLGGSTGSVNVPEGGGVAQYSGSRRRTGVDSVLQWRPTDDLEFVLEANVSAYKFTQDVYSLYAYGVTPVAGSYKVFAGTDNFESGELSPAFVEPYSFIGDRNSVVSLFALNSKWHHDVFDISSDISYTLANGNRVFNSLTFYVPSATNIYQDFSTPVPSMTLPGADLTNISNYTYGDISRFLSKDRGSEFDAKIDGTYATSGFVSAIKAGLRYTDRFALNESVSIYDASMFGDPVSVYPQGAVLAPVSNLFHNLDIGNSQLVDDYYAVPTNQLRNNFSAIQMAFGEPVGNPAYDPLAAYKLDEQTFAGYGLIKYGEESWALPVTGDLGVRIVGTKSDLSGNESVETGGYAPTYSAHQYTDVLPSFNLKATLAPNLYLRLAASKQLTRPDFADLSPTVNLDFTFRTGTTGNPNLSPLRANQLDGGLEWYFQPSGLIYTSIFYKNVRGFIQTVTQIEPAYNDFQITRPVNGGDGTIKGFEFGYQQFFDQLPKPFDGLGIQTNYTYVQSEAPSPVSDQLVPLEGLSKNSYNLVGIYEKYGVTARIAYNWRSNYVQTTAGAGTGNEPVFGKGGGQLDASISYDINRNTTVFVDGVNLTRMKSISYYGVPSQISDFSITDRRLGIGLRFKM